ncbi:MAG TPA: glycosyltransferase family 39 protein [Phycisphaerae bacterium]|nr:glycosyltransferase family 39 protein [Phycisphaerae bacterium]
MLRSRVFVWVGIPLLWAVAYLPGLGARDLMHEEGRRAEPAAEMLRGGDWVTPRLYGEAYLNKPPLFFWMAAGLGKLQGGVNELSVRIPSVISALLGAWLLVGFARKDLKREVRVLAGLILLATPVMLDKGTLGEIDAVLSLETFASFVVLWAGWDSESGRIRLWAWVVSGICMGIGALTKGPGGAIEFYGIVVPFLFLARGGGGWRKLRMLFSPGHFLMIGVAAVPVVVWAGLMLGQAHVGSGRLVGTWMDQLDFDLIPGMKKQVDPATVEVGEGGAAGRAWGHYKQFGVNAVTMVMPWVMGAVAGALPWFRRRVGTDRRRRALWLLLAVSFPALLVLFWAWPGANARYMMMVAYPVSVLGAWVVVEMGGGGGEGWARWWPVMRGAAMVMVAILGVGAFAAAVAAGLNTLTCVLAVAAIFSTQTLYQVTKRSPREQSGIAAVAMLAILVMVGWGIGKSIFNPIKAKTDATRRLHEQIDRVIVNRWPIYTTRTLSGGKGNNYFNAQFYLPGGAKALKSFSDLPVGRPVTVILAPEEMGALRAVAPGARELGRLQAANGPPPLVVAGVMR